MTKMLDGKISIHAEMGSRERRVVIFIEDKLSACEIMQIEMTMADFGNAITGHGHMPMKFLLQDTSKVGKKHEVKTEKIELNVKDKEKTNEDLKKYEVDGWVVNRKDIDNHHNLIKYMDNGKWLVRVSFHRWID